jgi:uncharacterized peroxidase-related enzyme
MAFVEPVSDEEASPPVAEMYEEYRARLGYVPNHARLFARRLAVYEAWDALSTEIKRAMGARRYELVTVAAARRLRSSYCTLAHGKILAEQFLEPETVRELVLDPGGANLDEVDAAVVRFAEKVVDDATSVTAEDVARLRELGLSEADVLDVAAAVGARCFFAKVLDALGAQPDAAYAELEPSLRSALTVGRPIAEA